jgi:hypothetical protein
MTDHDEFAGGSWIHILRIVVSGHSHAGKILHDLRGIGIALLWKEFLPFS